MTKPQLLAALCMVTLLRSPALAGQNQEHHQLRPVTVMGGGYDLEMNAKSVALGEQRGNGVTATAYIKETGALMAKIGRKENARFIVMFTGQASGATMPAGMASLKIFNAQDRQIGETIELGSAGETFEADAVLPVQGNVRLEVAFKEHEGQVRVFTFLLKR